MIDEIDLHILDIIQNDGRIANARLTWCLRMARPPAYSSGSANSKRKAALKAAKSASIPPDSSA